MRPQDINARLVAKYHLIWSAQGKVCYLCGARLRIGALGQGRLSMDHVRPRVKGGMRPRNILFAHQGCNEKKGQRKPRVCETLFLDTVNEIIDWRSLEAAE